MFPINFSIFVLVKLVTHGHIHSKVRKNLADSRVGNRGEAFDRSSRTGEEVGVADPRLRVNMFALVKSNKAVKAARIISPILSRMPASIEKSLKLAVCLKASTTCSLVLTARHRRCATQCNKLIPYHEHSICVAAH
jgi:hypothetical protein